MNYQFHWVSLVVLLCGLGWMVLTRLVPTPIIVVAPGFPLPALEFATANGSTVTTSHGRPQILSLWASWCPPCRAEIPVVAAIAPSLATRGIDVILVNQGETPADAQGFLTSQQITLPVWYDPQGLLATAVASRDLPTTVFVDASGVVRLVYRGPVSPDVLTNMANILTIGGQP